MPNAHQIVSRLGVWTACQVGWRGPKHDGTPLQRNAARRYRTRASRRTLRYITRHGTEATRKATRTQKTFDDAFPEIPSLSLLRKVEALRDETLTFAIKKNGLPPTQFLIDKEQLLSYAEKHHPGIVVNIQSLVRENSTIDRNTVIEQIKIWSVFKAEAETASLIFTVMFDIFEYHIEKRDGKRFPDPDECNWIVDLGLPAAHAEIRQRTLNTYENLKTESGTRETCLSSIMTVNLSTNMPKSSIRSISLMHTPH